MSPETRLPLLMPYSNGATLRFLVPAILRGSQKNVCRITRVSISADSVYYDDSDDSGTSSVIPIAYRPVSSIGSTDGESMDDDSGRTWSYLAIDQAHRQRICLSLRTLEDIRSALLGLWSRLT
uniref:Uncharacterized protein n=1 Tax=Anopheles culicifacies TaxID=139723 RepID=A0A182MV56_9DIPT